MEWELLVRLVGAAALGAVIGVERQLSDEVAGLRTHLLVAVGACVFSLMAAYGLSAGANLVVAAQVVSGIGFLGAGAILRSGFSVRGLPTAASLWLVASVGMAVALDHWAVGIGATVIALITLMFAKRAESGVLLARRTRLVEVTVTCQPAVTVDDLLAALRASGALARDVHWQLQGERRTVDLVFEVRGGRDPERPLDAIRRLASVDTASWTA